MPLCAYALGLPSPPLWLTIGPQVGSGGHTSFGGFGYFSRQAGLLLDTVVAADVVLANGTAITAAQSKYPDLFWVSVLLWTSSNSQLTRRTVYQALRGAAPSFGIVTAWHFATLPAPAQTINWQLSFSSFSTASSLATQLIAFQNWISDAQGVPNALGLSVVLGADGGKITLQYIGTFYGSQSDMNAALAHLRTFLPTGGKGHFTSTTQTNWLQGLEEVDGSLDTSKPDTVRPRCL